jgi:hypothetical protein
MNVNMHQIQTSDVTPTLVASQAFDSILQQIQTSNLNFQLQISPFSANISIKKTPIKDKFGVPVPFPCASSSAEDIAALVAKIQT